MPFVAVNCKAFTIESLDVELFGQESSGVNDTVAMKRGRIELADQGTLYLSEIGALSMELQVKLLKGFAGQEYRTRGRNGAYSR